MRFASVTMIAVLGLAVSACGMSKKEAAADLAAKEAAGITAPAALEVPAEVPVPAAEQVEAPVEPEGTPMSSAAE